MLRKQVKQKAKELLGGLWGRAMALLLALGAVSVFFSLLEQTIASLTGLFTLEQLFTPLFLYGTVTISFWPFFFAMLLLAGGLFLSFLFKTPLFQGNISWYYDLVSGEISPLKKAFFGYASLKAWLKILAVYFLLFVKVTLWNILFLLPAVMVYFSYCILVAFQAAAWQCLLLFILSVGLALIGLIVSLIVCYRYFLVPYILADDPCVHIKIAFKSSVRIMKGKKSELFSLDVSFLPYYFLSVFIVPMLWTLPYINTTKALYAKKYILNYQLEVLAKKQSNTNENTEI